MADTIRNEAALQALLADNTAGDISAQDLRDFLVSVPTLAITAGNASSQRTALGLGTMATAAAADYAALAGATFTGTITSTLGTITASTPAFTSTATFNNAGVTFSHFLVNVTNTASNAASRVFDVQVGGSTKLYVDVGGSVSFDVLNQGAGTVFQARSSGVALRSDLMYRWGSTNANGVLDTALARNAAGVVEINNGTAGTYRDLRARNVRTEPVTVASLVAAATAGKGARCFVTDANATTYASVVAGGGANNVPVYSDGTDWRIG